MYPNKIVQFDVDDFLKTQERYKSIVKSNKELVDRIFKQITSADSILCMETLNNIVFKPPILYVYYIMSKDDCDIFNKNVSYRQMLGSWISYIFKKLGYTRSRNINISQKYFNKKCNVMASQVYYKSKIVQDEV